jgi:Histidine kinase-, DNA gyrase B-, and HSP90-like ATPase/His Kinase A (phospho-acceptor) domain
VNASPFLAVPIKALISADGILLSADPPLWRLHVLAGGDADGPIAIPGLATIARLTHKTRMRDERSVRAADEENDVELWVAAAPKADGVELIVTGWRDLMPVETGFKREEQVNPLTQMDNRLLIGPDLKLVRAPASLTTARVGEHIGALFVMEADDSGRIPLVEALNERRAVASVEVGIVGQEGRYILTLSPEFSGDGDYLGLAGTLAPIAPPIVEPPVDPKAIAPPMGRQFASVLKQPLSRIMANADTIGSRLHGPLKDNYAEYAQDIANAARHLSELVNDMEDLEAIDRPDFAVARDPVELGDLARRVAGLLALKASDHGIQLVLPEVGEKVSAVGEFRRVLQILLNLVGNAIRYAPAGSKVTIAIEKRAAEATVIVADEGQGIASEDRERIFEKFERLGRSGDGGSGLGLYISRRLARAMGGELSASEAPSGGALFRLTLPER